jgi:hypothetical protein
VKTSSPTLLRRRSLLSALGASAFLAVPVFRQSLVEAQGAQPKRAIFVQWPGGVPERCFQLGMCNNARDLPNLTWFDFDGQLEAYAPIKSDTILLRNLDAPSSARGGEGHSAGMRGLLTARSSGGGGITSVDQYIAKQVGNLTPFSSLQVGAFYPNQGQQDLISYADGFGIASERDPRTLFEKLFGGGNLPSSGSGEPDPAALKRLAQRKSILDFLRTEIGAVQATTGSAEKPLLDLHLESLRELEKQITQGATAAGTDCAAPDLTGITRGQFDPVTSDDYNQDVRRLAQLQLDILYQAINCDLTRIATFQWATSVEVDVLYSWVPGYNSNPDQHHSFQHDHESVENEAIFRGIQKWFVSETATLVQRMKATAEGSGSLLDNSVVMVTSEMANGTHILTPLPVLLCGSLGGAFQNMGTTFDANWRGHNDLLLAIAAGMGAPLTTIGDAQFVQGPLNL